LRPAETFPDLAPYNLLVKRHRLGHNTDTKLPGCCLGALYELLDTLGGLFGCSLDNLALASHKFIHCLEALLAEPGLAPLLLWRLGKQHGLCAPADVALCSISLCAAQCAKTTSYRKLPAQPGLFLRFGSAERPNSAGDVAGQTGPECFPNVSGGESLLPSQFLQQAHTTPCYA
jgi:hypothetical protein